jgi:hypothetical protein
MSHGHSKDADQRQRAAELGARANLLSRRALEVTTPVYWPDDQRDPTAVGSAVLLALGEARFLLTAAHVLDFRHKGPLAASAGRELIPVDTTKHACLIGPLQGAADALLLGTRRAKTGNASI